MQPENEGEQRSGVAKVVTATILSKQQPHTTNNDRQQQDTTSRRVSPRLLALWKQREKRLSLLYIHKEWKNLKPQSGPVQPASTQAPAKTKKPNNCDDDNDKPHKSKKRKRSVVLLPSEGPALAQRKQNESVKTTSSPEPQGPPNQRNQPCGKKDSKKKEIATNPYSPNDNGAEKSSNKQSSTGGSEESRFPDDQRENKAQQPLEKSAINTDGDSTAKSSADSSSSPPPSLSPFSLFLQTKLSKAAASNDCDKQRVAVEAAQEWAEATPRQRQWWQQRAAAGTGNIPKAASTVVWKREECVHTYVPRLTTARQQTLFQQQQQQQRHKQQEADQVLKRRTRLGVASQSGGVDPSSQRAASSGDRSDAPRKWRRFKKSPTSIEWSNSSNSRPPGQTVDSHLKPPPPQPGAALTEQAISQPANHRRGRLVIDESGGAAVRRVVSKGCSNRRRTAGAPISVLVTATTDSTQSVTTSSYALFREAKKEMVDESAIAQAWACMSPRKRQVWQKRHDKLLEQQQGQQEQRQAGKDKETEKDERWGDGRHGSTTEEKKKHPVSDSYSQQQPGDSSCERKEEDVEKNDNHRADSGAVACRTGAGSLATKKRDRRSSQTGAAVSGRQSKKGKVKHDVPLKPARHRGCPTGAGALRRDAPSDGGSSSEAVPVEVHPPTQHQPVDPPCRRERQSSVPDSNANHCSERAHGYSHTEQEATVRSLIAASTNHGADGDGHTKLEARERSQTGTSINNGLNGDSNTGARERSPTATSTNNGADPYLPRGDIHSRSQISPRSLRTKGNNSFLKERSSAG